MSQPQTKLGVCEIPTRDDFIQLNHRVDEIAENIQKLTEKLLNDGQEKLDKWREDSLVIINHFYEQKSRELYENCSEKFLKLKYEIEQIRCHIDNLIQEEITNTEDIQLLTSNIQHIQQKLKDSQEKHIQINIQSFTISQNLISIEKSISDDFNLSLLSSPCHTVRSSNGKSWSIASNNKHVLIDQYPNLYLLDKNLTIVNQYPWKSDQISDICWSNILNKFILMTKNKIYLVDEEFSSIEQIRSIQGEHWWSCTCSNDSLFLTTKEKNSSIYQYNYFPSFQLVRQWKPVVSNEQEEFIYDITYQFDKLGLIVNHSPSRTANLTVRSSSTFDLLWSYQLDINYKWFQTAIRCCSLTNDQWFVIEEYTSYIYHIDKYGTLKGKREYSFQPWNAIVFGTDLLAIRTDAAVNFHKL